MQGDLVCLCLVRKHLTTDSLIGWHANKVCPGCVLVLSLVLSIFIALTSSAVDLTSSPQRGSGLSYRRTTGWGWGEGGGGGGLFTFAQLSIVPHPPPR